MSSRHYAIIGGVIAAIIGAALVAAVMNGGSASSEAGGPGELSGGAPESAGGATSEGAGEREPAAAGSQTGTDPAAAPQYVAEYSQAGPEGAAPADPATAPQYVAGYSPADSPGAGGQETEAAGAPSAASPAVMVTDGTRHTIPLDRIFSGGPPKDGIPSIDDPVFAAADHDGISDGDVVLGVEIGGDARAYPLSILVWHEIVNDVVGGTPISVTYCPLCYTNQVFERVVGDQPVEFGVSGKLYNSNLLMYDRLTDSYWSQATGEAVVGELAGAKLDIVPFDVITWGDWRGLNPDTLVLTTDTGYDRPYGVDPYERYFATDRIVFPVSNRDDRLGEKTVILGFGSQDSHRAYVQSDVEGAGAINDVFDGVPILLISEYEQNARAFERTAGGQDLTFGYDGGSLVDAETGSVWGYDGAALSGPLEGQQLKRLGFSPGFWFEWVAFHPETELYGDS